MTEQYAIECRQITKAFGSVVANDKIDLTVGTARLWHFWEKMVPVRQRS